jgi:imidazolonepropionase
MTSVQPAPPADVFLRGIGLLVTNDPDREGLLGAVADAAVVVRAGTIVWAGPETEVPAGGDLPEVDLEGRCVLPGFVDAHTHAVFAGDRADEFGRRCRGETYEEIMAAGGGIMSTVAATRSASDEDLVRAASGRLEAMLASGTTTVEVKSGYGLEVGTEKRLLEVARRLGDELPIDVVPTFLGAHTVPPEATSREEYLREIVDEMLPVCAPLARFCDVFCDEGLFSVEEAGAILRAGRAHGLEPRLHANQLAPSGGAALAAEVGAASADHLDHVTDAEIAAMAAAGTIAVLLPGVSLSLRTPFPDPARFLEAGVTVAIATDANPGTSYILTMPFVVALACLEMGMSPEQAVWSATRGGALALRMDDRGWIRPGAAADLVVLDAESYVHLPYRPDANLVRGVVKGGALVGGLQ